MGIVAAIQTPPIYLDSMACAQRAVERIAEVAEHGAWLAVFPETFIPGDRCTTITPLLIPNTSKPWSAGSLSKRSPSLVPRRSASLLHAAPII